MPMAVSSARGSPTPVVAVDACNYVNARGLDVDEVLVTALQPDERIPHVAGSVCCCVLLVEKEEEEEGEARKPTSQLKGERGLWVGSSYDGRRLHTNARIGVGWFLGAVTHSLYSLYSLVRLQRSNPRSVAPPPALHPLHYLPVHFPSSYGCAWAAHPSGRHARTSALRADTLTGRHRLRHGSTQPAPRRAAQGGVRRGAVALEPNPVRRTPD
jgi:hypothetical protein